VLFARRDITAGEELTVNYRYFLGADADASSSFVDVATGHPVTGLDAAEALRRSTEELLELLPFIAEDLGGERTRASAQATPLGAFSGMGRAQCALDVNPVVCTS